MSESDEFQTMGWEEYKNGFGDPKKGTAYWMGLEKMHEMTSWGKWQLILVIRAKGKEHTFNYVIYDDFKIRGEMVQYQLNIGSVDETYGFFRSADAMDLTYSNKQPFSTKDRDNDEYNENCAADYRWNGGWWFKSCAYLNLNAKRSEILYHLKKESNNVVVSETQMAMKRVKND